MKPVCKMTQVADLIPDGATVLIAGFLGVGAPLRIIDALVAAGRKNLTLIVNDTARPDLGVGKLIAARAVKKLYASHIGTNPETQRQMLAGELDVELVPQGTLVERIRAHGFGLGGVLTKTGLGTVVAEKKRIIDINGESWLLDLPLGADFALIHAHKADYVGNLTYQYTADNFNTIMAMAGKKVIVEADEIVAVGEIAPDDVKTPGVVVDYLLESRA
ncbi:MAG: 3-oxoacid CoA-transferase subunit A [Oligoflexia bacterium]|nr:3-oxoacid CoA-transferase subunit A [Oligoflexia bacterium]